MRTTSQILKAGDPGTAIGIVSNPRRKILAGGTNLLDLMKEDVMHLSGTGGHQRG